MATLVRNGATLKCDKGTAPASLTVLPVGPLGHDDQPVATVADILGGIKDIGTVLDNLQAT